MLLSIICFLLLSKISVTSDVKVLELTAEFFENYTKKTDGTTVVMFYAPWCPHCQDAKPELFKAASKMAKSNSKNTFALLNCEDTKNTDICQQQNIEGYPTIKAFGPNEKVHIYNGQPTEENLLKFIENPDEFSKSIDSTQDETGSNKDDENMPDLPLNYTKYLNKENFNETLINTKHALVFFYAPWCPHCQESKPNLDKASEKLKSKDHSIFAVNCEDPKSKSLCVESNIEGYPTFRYYHNGEFYAEYEDELTTEAYLLYLSKPPKEKVKETSRTKPEDQTPDEKMEFVKYLTTEEIFLKELKERKRHTMVMYYVPWCSNCQSAKPIYNLAAKEIKITNPLILFAAVNCNDELTQKLCEKEDITGYPTFVHYYEGQDQKIYKETPLTVEKLIKYFKVSKKEEL